MICRLCEPKATKRIPKKFKNTISSHNNNEFRNRLICAICRSKIHNFIKLGRNEFIIYYCDLNAIFFAKETDSCPILDRSCKTITNDYEIFEELILSGWNINDKNFGGVEIFYEACAADDIGNINFFLGLGFDINKYGRAAIGFACTYSSFKVYKRLKRLEIEPVAEHIFKAVKAKN